ncbi:HNH endonuclease [Nocardioides sp.]|uniref:HNH endonuclease n=1 Tax=Nocardioides sp. TaxID=35761 RepID=UPI002733EF26|nr:HNH endonuclease signature motif containing protein [Nocardioides sp.]MDP3893844.1 HNH endonuclease signature motif containing protein [Nocardioides sp.]
MVSRSRTATYARRRKRRMATAEHDLTDDQWVALQEAWAGCAYCRAEGPALQKDCILPISRGGRYTLTNVVPACGSCNASKCNLEVSTWMRRKKLDEQGFLVRQAETLQALAGPSLDGVEEPLDLAPGAQPMPHKVPEGA